MAFCHATWHFAMPHGILPVEVAAHGILPVEVGAWLQPIALHAGFAFTTELQPTITRLIGSMVGDISKCHLSRSLLRVKIYMPL